VRRLLAILLVSALALFELGSAAFADDVYVRGYTRKDGTCVAPHYRSTPDGSPYNNWSTRGNVNPYSGVAGAAVLLVGIDLAAVVAGEFGSRSVRRSTGWEPSTCCKPSEPSFYVGDVDDFNRTVGELNGRRQGELPT